MKPPVRQNILARTLCAAILLCGTPPAHPQTVPVESCGIASASPLATNAGCEILARGGNAFDAAVVVSAMLAVVEPFASGLGGGGFYLLHRHRDRLDVFVDARETAPGRAAREFYLDQSGAPRAGLSLDGPTAAGIPGTPAALDWIEKRYGALSLARTLAPAIRIARSGYPVDARYVRAAGFRQALFQRYAETSGIFLAGGKVPAAGFVLKQPRLAATLEAIAGRGGDGFYRGEIATRLVNAVQAAGGLWTLEDLAGYRVVERQPIRFEFRGARIVSAPLPSSGGLVMAQALQMLEPLPLQSMSDTQRAHYIVEAWRRAYNDRARYMGDSDFVKVPVAKLLSREYALRRGADIDPDRATPSSALPSAPEPIGEGEETTHFSIIDREGNRVAATQSINGPFGSGFVAGDTGVLLNNHMDDFSLAPSVPNAYRLVGGYANAVAPGKRPLSSMAPTFVEDDRGVLVLGTPGGSRIITMVTLGILDYVLHPEVDVQRIVSLPRYHHQYLPDRIEIEPASFSEQWMAALRAKGHAVETGRRRWGNMQVVFQGADGGPPVAASDPRGKAGVLF